MNRTPSNNQNDLPQNSWNYNPYYNSYSDVLPSDDFSNYINTQNSEFSSGNQYGEWGTFDSMASQPLQPTATYSCIDNQFNYEVNSETPVYTDISRNTAVNVHVPEQDAVGQNYSNFRYQQSYNNQNINTFNPTQDTGFQYDQRSNQVTRNPHSTYYRNDEFSRPNNQPMNSNSCQFGQTVFENSLQKQYEEINIPLRNTYNQVNQYGTSSNSLTTQSNMYGQSNIQEPRFTSRSYFLPPTNQIILPNYTNIHGAGPSHQRNFTQLHIQGNVTNTNNSPLTNSSQQSQGTYLRGGTSPFICPPPPPPKRKMETVSSDFRAPPNVCNRLAAPLVDPLRNSTESRNSYNSQRDRTPRRNEYYERPRRIERSPSTPKITKRHDTPFPDIRSRRRQGTPAPWGSSRATSVTRTTAAPQVPPIQMTGTMRDFLLLRQLNNNNQTTASANSTSSNSTMAPPSSQPSATISSPFASPLAPPSRPSSKSNTVRQVNPVTSANEPGHQNISPSAMNARYTNPQTGQTNRNGQINHPSSVNDSSRNRSGLSSMATTPQVDTFLYQHYGQISSTQVPETPSIDIFSQSAGANLKRSPEGSHHSQLSQVEHNYDQAAFTKKRENTLGLFQKVYCSRFPQCSHQDCSDASFEVQHLKTCQKFGCYFCTSAFEKVRHATYCSYEGCCYSYCKIIKKVQKEIEEANELQRIISSVVQFDENENERKFDSFNMEEVHEYMINNY